MDFENKELENLLQKYLAYADIHKKKILEQWIMKLRSKKPISTKALKFITDILLEIETRKQSVEKLKLLSQGSPQVFAKQDDILEQISKEQYKSPWEKLSKDREHHGK